VPGIHRERPGAADLAVATGEPAVALGDGIWMSPGVSNSYAIATNEGRVIVNGGLFFEGAQRLKTFADVPGPTRADRRHSVATPITGAGQRLARGRHRRDHAGQLQVLRDDNVTARGLPGTKTAFAFQKFTDAVMSTSRTSIRRRSTSRSPNPPQPSTET